MSLAYVRRAVLAGPIVLLLTLGAGNAAAQARADSIVGASRDTSRCIDKVAFPACNDEEVANASMMFGTRA